MSKKVPADLCELVLASRCTLVGEVHGTNQFIEAFMTLVRAISLRSSKAVCVHLEIPKSLEHAIDLFVRTGVEPSRESLRLLVEDSRWSSAITNQLSGIRDLVDNGQVLLFCCDSVSAKDQESRELEMARNLHEVICKNPDGIHIALMGNVHAMIEPNGKRRFSFTTAGTLLAEKIPDVVSINLTTSGGNATVLTGTEAGETLRRTIDLRPSLGGAEPGEFRPDRDPSSGFSGEWNIGRVTAVKLDF